MITQTILRISPTAALVASHSEVGRWHVVRPESCDCKGFQYRTRCRHLAIAFPSIESCEHCGGLTDLVTESRFIAGVGQVEETRCRDLLGCDQREAGSHDPAPVAVAPKAPPASVTVLDIPAIRGLYPQRSPA